jgi:replication factor A1
MKPAKGWLLNISDLKLGMSHVNITVKVLNASDSKQVVKSAGVDHEILELEMGDMSGSIKLVLWDEKIISNLKTGDKIKIENGFVTSFKGVWRINVGRYGEAKKV